MNRPAKLKFKRVVSGDILNRVVVEKVAIFGLTALGYLQTRRVFKNMKKIPIDFESVYKKDSQRILENISVNENGCWIWLDRLNTRGQPVFLRRFKSRKVPVHRVAMKIFGDSNEIGPKDCVIRTCENNRCVYPGHYRVVSRCEVSRQNMQRYKELHGRLLNQKLIAEEVDKIRDMRRGGYTLKSIAALFGVSQIQVSRIARGIQGNGRINGKVTISNQQADLVDEAWNRGEEYKFAASSCYR